MTTGEIEPRAPVRSALVAALGVYVEPLLASARVVVLGDATSGLAEALFEEGAHSVHVFDPDAARAARAAIEAPRGIAVRPLDGGDFDLRDAAFDLALVPDIARLADASATISRLRRVVDARGAVVALAKARAAEDAAAGEAWDDLAPSTFAYAELYDLFALSFEHVTMTGVLPFGGVVFAELGGEGDVAVSVDTRLGEAQAPSVFVVVAGREPTSLDPYAIVQTGQPESRGPAVSDASGDAAAFAAAQLRVQLLSVQLDEHRTRLMAAESRGGDAATRLARTLDDQRAENAALREELARAESLVARVSLERDAVGLRAAELETAIIQTQQRMVLLERRLASAAEGLLERDDAIASLNAELDARAAAEEDQPDVRLVVPALDPALVEEVLARAERAEAELAAHVTDLANVSEAHATDTEALEAQLQERARVIADLEQEVARRDGFVRELVTQLQDLRDGLAPVLPPAMPSADVEELARLRRKADELALEVARRESELVAEGWRAQEIEAQLRRSLPAVLVEPPPITKPSAPPLLAAGPEHASAAARDDEVLRLRDEIGALRQALTQEHAARVAAESGEALERARAELARQAVLLAQLRTAGVHGRDA
jgi:hypothetical protein